MCGVESDARPAGRGMLEARVAAARARVKKGRREDGDAELEEGRWTRTGQDATVE